jgi:hypothetical protein
MPSDKTLFYLIVIAAPYHVITCIHSCFTDRMSCLELRCFSVPIGCRPDPTQNGTGVADAVVAKENSIEIPQQVRIAIEAVQDSKSKDYVR